MKKKILALALCVAMVLSLLPTGVFATEEEEIWSVTGIVVANERYVIATDPEGNTLDSYSVYPTGSGSGESVIYYEATSASGIVYADTLTIDRALDDDLLGTKVAVNFTADKSESSGIAEYNNLEVVGDVILHEDTVAYTVPALNVDIMPNGNSTSLTEIRPYISFTVDGTEHKIEMSSDVAKIAMRDDAQVMLPEDLLAEINQFAYVLDGHDIGDDGDLVLAAGSEFIDCMGLPSLSQYRFVSVDGGETYSYMFKMIDEDNSGYGYVSAYNRATGIIRITGVPGLGTLELGTEAVVNSGVYVDEMVVVYRENGKVVVDPVETFNAAVEEFTDNGVMLNGEEYFAWIDCENVYGAGYNTIFEYYNEERDAMGAKTKYYTYNNLIFEIDADSSSVGDALDYAVVLQSYYDADMDAAYVKLGFADDSEGTYKVGKTYMPKPSEPSYEENNRMIDFANNSAFGYVLKYAILSDGTVDLSAQDLKAVNDSDSTLRTFRDGGSVVDGRFNGLYSYSDDTIIYALYGNPGYYVNDTAVKVDTTVDGYKPVKSKAFKLSEIKDMNAGDIENLYMASFIDGAIECISEGMGSYIVDTAAQANHYVVAGAMTVGANLAAIMIAYDVDYNIAYVVSATQRYNSATDLYYAEFTLIDESGKFTAKTIDDVQNDCGISMLNYDDGVGVLDGERLDENGNPVTNWTGCFVRYAIDDDGIITMLDTGDDWGSYTVSDAGIEYQNGTAMQGLYLVNVVSARNEIVSFYDCYVEEDGWCTIKDIQASSLCYAEKGCDIVGIDSNDYAGNNLNFISKYTEYLPARDGGNAIVYVNEDGQIEKIFSFTPNYVVDGSLADFDEIEEGTYEDLSWSFTYGAVTYCSEEKDIIRIAGASPVEGTYKLSELVIKGDVATDTLVVCYKDGDECIVEAVGTVTGDIEEFTSDGIVVGGNEYLLWPESEIACNYSSFFEFWSDTKEQFTSNAKFLVHDNYILNVEFDETPAPIENYAVVLRSYYDADTDTAYVKLGFTDDTEGTYKVGKLYTPRTNDITHYDNNLPRELANNSLFGVVVNFKLMSDGSLDLSGQDFEEIMSGDADAKTKLFTCGGANVVDKGRFQGKYAYNDDTVIFALYGNPYMYVDSESNTVGVIAGASEYNNPYNVDVTYPYAPVKAKMYKLSELDNLDGNVIPNLRVGDYVSGGAYVAGGDKGTDVNGSYVLSTTKNANNYIVVAAVTVGYELADANVVYDVDASIAYAVSATQRYNAATDLYYAEFTLIGKDGKITAKTVDDVQNDNSVSMLEEDDGIGKLDGRRNGSDGNAVNNWSGVFVRYAMNADGMISMIDTGDYWGSYVPQNTMDYTGEYPYQGLYLVNLYDSRNDIIFFYDTDADVDLKTEAAQSAKLCGDGYNVIGIDEDNYVGEELSFIPPRTEYIHLYDGEYLGNNGAGNAVIYINEDGEIETIFSFGGIGNGSATISYDLNGGEGSIPSFTKRTGTDVLLSEEVPVREHYTFLGWATSADAIVAEYQPGGLYDGDADAVLYAVWEANKYTITYLVDGEEYKSCELAYGEVITPEAEPGKDGYIFSGWSEIPETMPGKDVTVTGTFEEIEIIPVTGVILNKTTLSLEEGKTETLTVTVQPSDATDKSVTWKSSDSNVATVVGGVITAKAAGNATVTVTTVDGKHTAICEVTVTETSDAIITVSNSRARAGETVTVVVSIKNNPGLAGLQLSCLYDSALELIAIEKGTALENLNFTVSKDLEANPVMLPWDGEVDDSSNGEIVKLTFCVKEDAEVGQYSINCIPVAAYDYDLVDVEVLCIAGIVDVVDYIPGDINDDEIVDVKDVTVLRRYIAGGYNVTVVEDALDVNRDEVVDVKDVTVLRRYIAGGYGVELK